MHEGMDMKQGPWANRARPSHYPTTVPWLPSREASWSAKQSTLTGSVRQADTTQQGGCMLNHRWPSPGSEMTARGSVLRSTVGPAQGQPRMRRPQITFPWSLNSQTATSLGQDGPNSCPTKAQRPSSEGSLPPSRVTLRPHTPTPRSALQLLPGVNKYLL